MTSARATWLRLTLFGLLSGLIASLAVLAFEAAIDFGQSLLLPPAEADDYSALDPLPRLMLPVLGGFLLGVVTALLELTANPNIILPGMLAVASAELTNRLALGKESVFETLMRMGRTP